MSGAKKDSSPAQVPPIVSSKDERKLKPIFDLVDEGNYKQAITQLDKFLRKNTNSANGLQTLAATHQAKALRCLCLWRMPGRQAEATVQADLLSTSHFMCC